MPITSTGIGSGLDVESLVAQLVLSEIQPRETRLNTAEVTYQSEISSYGLIKSAVSDFQTATKAAANVDTYQAKSTSASDYMKLSATATTGAAEASYDLTVSALATKHGLATATGYETTSSVVGTGKLSIAIGTTSYNSGTDVYSSFTQKTGTSAVEVTIDSSNNTLAGVRDAINGSTAGVVASIIYDGSNYRLALAAKDSGVGNTVAITVDDDDTNDTNTSGLSNLSFSSGATNLTQTVAGTDAALTINGLAVTSSSNVVSGAIESLDITLKETFSGIETVTVTNNTGTIKAAVEGFVDAYNDLIDVLNTQTSYNSETGSSSTLTGDATVRTLIGNIRSYLNDEIINPYSNYGYAAQLGFKTNTVDGKISIDNAKLDAALAADPLDVATIFAGYGRATNSNVQFVSSTSQSEEGAYAVSFTPAVSGSILGAALANNLNFSGAGNQSATFDITVDGEAASITINEDFGSDAAAAAGVQSAINAALATKSVSVTLAGGSGDQLLIQSTTAGSSSSVAVSNLDNDANDLGLNSVSTTSGADALGAIGGFAATINGTELTGLTGSNTEGIKLKILGGASADLGSIYYSRGIASKLDTLLDGLLASDGLVEARLTGLASSVADIADARIALAERADNLEAIYRNQFNGLETLISGINETGAFLTQALSNFVDPLSFKK
jgi:flagellar hook-associated protein 2